MLIKQLIIAPPGISARFYQSKTAPDLLLPVLFLAVGDDGDIYSFSVCGQELDFSSPNEIDSNFAGLVR